MYGGRFHTLQGDGTAAVRRKGDKFPGDCHTDVQKRTADRVGQRIEAVMGIFDFLRSSVRQQETVSDVQEERTALSDLQQYVRSNSPLGSHASERDAAGGTGLRLPEFGGKNLAETAPISAEAEGKTLEQIADGKRISKTMEQYEGEYRRLQNGFERNFYDGSAGRTEKAELGKQYCQNVNAICEMRDREKTLGHELDGVKNQMAAMHMDHPNGFSTADRSCGVRV